MGYSKELRVYWCLALIALLFVTFVKASCDDKLMKHYEEIWYEHKAKYNKTYRSHENKNHQKYFIHNSEYVFQHNVKFHLKLHNFSLRVNHFADLNNKLYNRKMVKLTPNRNRRLIDDVMVGSVHHDPCHIPDSLDWRDKGFDIGEQNQLSCGSCYSYSIAGAISGQLYKRNGKIINLSVQQLVDCSTKMGNLGCSGGSLRNTLRYLEKTKGIMAEHYYPYIAKQGPCKYQEKLRVTNITKWAILPPRDERSLQAAVATIGPIAASVNAGLTTFQLYHSGIYDDIACTADVVNHAILIVGYTKDFWILQNWWGTGWGENGFMRLKKGVNLCGIANYAAYVKID